MSDPITVAALAEELGTEPMAIAPRITALAQELGALEVFQQVRDLGATVLTGNAADIVRELHDTP